MVMEVGNKLAQWAGILGQGSRFKRAGFKLKNPEETLPLTHNGTSETLAPNVIKLRVFHIASFWFLVIFGLILALYFPGLRSNFRFSLIGTWWDMNSSFSSPTISVSFCCSSKNRMTILSFRSP